jgi:hypothetical protein
MPSSKITSARIAIGTLNYGLIVVRVGFPGQGCGRRHDGSFDWNLTSVLPIDGLSGMPFKRHHEF